MKMRIHRVTRSIKSRFQQWFTIWSRRRVDLHLWKRLLRRQLLVMRMIDPPLSYDKYCLNVLWTGLYIIYYNHIRRADCKLVVLLLDVVWIYFRKSFNFLAVHYFVLNRQNGCVTDAKRTKIDLTTLVESLKHRTSMYIYISISIIILLQYIIQLLQEFRTFTRIRRCFRNFCQVRDVRQGSLDKLQSLFDLFGKQRGK
jgi:hypothetical protein